jgi:hypothetical protein
MEADRAIAMRNSILVVMKCKCKDREREANDQEIENFSLHRVSNLLVCKRKVKGAYAAFFVKAYFLF